MKPIPKTKNALVLRTDFSNQAIWKEICEVIRELVGDAHFLAYVDFVDNVEYADISKEQLMKLIPKDYNHTFIILADQVAISHPDHPLLIIDLHNGSGRDFRAIPSQIQGIENNLSIANMDFEEFADSVDEDGVFRGFERGD